MFVHTWGNADIRHLCQLKVCFDNTGILFIRKYNTLKRNGSVTFTLPATVVHYSRYSNDKWNGMN